MKIQLEKVYDFKSVEDATYQRWLEKDWFHAEPDESKTPYTIVIPPPNVTGQLHMGHALNTSLQDILIRTKRMQGYNALWIPGTDHASISTEVIIVEKMAQEGLTKEALGREAFLDRAWKWKEEYGGRILGQLKKLGCSCDWERERFTMDDGLNNAVKEVFIRLYEKGYIYRGEKLINWCPTCRTTISDAEVDHEEKDAHFWYLKYKLDDADDYLTFATTRPETMLGDTAIAVNPKDGRYAKYIGRTVTVPVVNRRIPVIADEYVDMETGTGVVKITPAHDPNDFAVGERHNLPRINVMNDDGTMNENAGIYKGLTTSECRKRIVADFDALGLLVKTEGIKHSVGTHERCGHVIEPLIKLQWFVKMEEMAKPAIEAYTSGALNIMPERVGKIYLNWLTNIRDWCISRQLWWGHRIPAYYCDSCSKITVSRELPECCPECGAKGLRQDEDVLDTWFSSALWPFSTLGWPEQTPELKHFYPTNVLVTAYDIIFFWVVRMVFSGIEQMGELPFKDVLINGIVRDSQGRKMSKSLGNGLDPMEVIEKYGADALRLSLVMGTTPGSDMRFHWEKVEACRNFLNKIWNAARFILAFDGDIPKEAPKELHAADKWILSKLNTLIKSVTDNIEGYELGLAAQHIYDFYWDEFCDWYIEMVKPRLYNEADITRQAALYTLNTVLVNALKLLHPFMPFITEKLFMSVQTDEESIMISDWPVYSPGREFVKEEKEIELIKEAVKNIRNIRAEMNVPPSRKITAFLVSQNETVKDIFARAEVFFKTLAGVGELFVAADGANAGEGAVTSVIDGGVIMLPIADLVDIEKEKARLNKDRERLENEVLRAEQRLSNPGFVNKAPNSMVEAEKEKLNKYKSMLTEVERQIKLIGGAAI